VEIEYKKGSIISDKIKSKLYLAGIINYKEKDVEIKNQVIREALGMAWIQSLEREEKGLFRAAHDYYQNGNYELSLVTYEGAFVENDLVDEDINYHYYRAAFSAYRISNYQKAVNYIRKVDFKSSSDQTMFRTTEHLKGLLYFLVGSIDESIECFEQLLQFETDDDLRISALLNYGAVCLASEKPEYIQKSQEIFLSILNDEQNLTAKSNISSDRDIKSICYYNLGLISIEKKDIEQAQHDLEKAYTLSPIYRKPAVLVRLLSSKSNYTDISSIVEEVSNLIISEEVTAKPYDPDNTLEFTLEIFLEFLSQLIINFSDEYETLIVPLLKKLDTHDIKSQFLRISDFCVNEIKEPTSAVKVLQNLIKLKNQNRVSLQLLDEAEVYKMICYYIRPQINEIYFDR
jgi:tetratricopeptide (TPR) repeat protein